MLIVFTPREAAEYLNIKLHTLNQYISRGIGPVISFHVNGSRRYSKEALDNYIERRKKRRRYLK